MLMRSAGPGVPEVFLSVTAVRTGAHMPALFTGDRTGFVERWLVADVLGGTRSDTPPPGDHRRGRLAFLSLGCFACHLVPDLDTA